MNRDDIIRMAREAGLVHRDDKTQSDAYLFAMPDRIERFAALVAAEVAKCEGCGKPHALYCLKCCEESIVQTAVKEEREACASIIEECCEHCAATIRAMGDE